MIEGSTSTGYSYCIEDKVLKDWRFVRCLSQLKDLEENSESVEFDFVSIMSEMEKILFSDKGKSLEKHIAKLNDGTIPTDVLLKELIEVIKTNEETKN